MPKIGAKLDRDIENDLILRAQAGDGLARNRLIEHHYPFILAWTAKAIPRGDDPNQYLSHAVTAFIRAILAFRPELGNCLLTFAATAINREVRRAKAQDRTVRPPTTITSARNNHLANRTAHTQSLDLITKSGLHPFEQRSNPRENPATLAEHADLARWILSRLQPRDRHIVTRRLQGATLASIGDELGLSKERVRQLHDHALNRARRLLDQHPDAA